MIISLLAVSSALAQQTDRVLHFTATSDTKNLQEIARVICAITDIPQTSVDMAENSLPLRGTASQVALAEWLLSNLDQPSSVPHDDAKYEYRISHDDVVRLFFLTNPEVPMGVQEIATAVRALAGVRQMFTYNDLRAVVVRGTSEQINLAEFFFGQMDKPGIPGSGASAEFRMGSDSLARVVYLPNTKTVQDFQQLVTAVRTIARLRYAFTYNIARAVGLRGTDEQVALAKWLFEDLDGAKGPDSGGHQYRIPSSSDDFVRVFYLAHAATSQHLGETMLQIQSKTHNAWVCIYNAPSAIVVRGTAQQIVRAAELTRQEDN